MKVLTRFQSPYDKYLFEGIINPEDYYSFVGTSLNGQITYSSSETIVSLYVLNTLDHTIKIEPENPENIITKFFSSILTSSKPEVTDTSGTFGFKSVKNLLLISVQHPKVLNDVVAYFSSLEKSIRPNEPVIVYTISSLTLFSQINDQLKNTIEQYGKHTYIDISLALTAIELFKRRKLVDIYGSELKELKGIGYDLLNHTDKKVIIDSLQDTRVLYIPKIKIDDNVLKNISEFLDMGTNESYCKRLVPLIPKFNYRYYDKLETFYRASLQELKVPYRAYVYKVLIIRNSELKVLSFKILLYISIFKWNLIFFESDVSESNQQHISNCYEQLNSIYNDKSVNIKMSKTELKKLNPDYSLLRREKEIKDFENAVKTIFPEQKSTISDIPHIMIDNYDDIKTYLKKLENSLSVDKIVMKILEL